MTWPTTLPSFSLESWTWTKGASIIENKMELGPPKRRSRSTSSPDVVTGTISLSESEVKIFRNFVDGDLGRGLHAFTWRDFMTEQDRTAYIRAKGNQLYSIKKAGAHSYNVRLTLELI